MVRLTRYLLGASWLGVAALVLVACGGDAEEGDERLRVVATTGVIAEFAREIAGNDASVSQIVPSGVDVHAFEPSPDAIRRIAEADLVLVNGYNLEEGLLDAVRESRSAGSSLIVVSAGLEPLTGGHAHEEDAADSGDDAADGDHAPPAGTAAGTAADAIALMSAEGDPHFWLDPHLATHYVEAIRDALATADPEHAAAYRDRAAAYIERLDALDAEVAAVIAGVPAERRKLVVFHDAFSYFAAAYGIEIVAALVPGGANAEPSAREVGAVVEAIRQHDVRAVYAEPQFSSQLIDAVAEEASIPVLTLYSDATGEGVANYEEMMRANARAIADGLGGQA